MLKKLRSLRGAGMRGEETAWAEEEEKEKGGTGKERRKKSSVPLASKFGRCLDSQ